jgi:hypothetical protein
MHDALATIDSITDEPVVSSHMSNTVLRRILIQALPVDARVPRYPPTTIFEPASQSHGMSRP